MPVEQDTRLEEGLRRIFEEVRLSLNSSINESRNTWAYRRGCLDGRRVAYMRVYKLLRDAFPDILEPDGSYRK